MKTKHIFLILTCLFTLAVGVFFIADPGMNLISSNPGLMIPQIALVTILPAQLFNPSGQEIPPFTRAQKFLFDYLRQKSNLITDDAVKSGAIVFDPITYYIRYAITGLSGRIKFLGSATQQVDGITNFPNQAYLPQYYNFCFDSIEVNYGTTAVSATDSPATCTNYSSVRSAFPAGLANGELILSLNKNVIVRTPMTDYLSKVAVSGGGSRDYDGGTLQEPKIIQENLLFEGEAQLVGTIPSATNTSYFMEVLLKGVQARLRS